MRVAKRNQLRGRAQALPWESVKARLVEQAGQHMGRAARCLPTNASNARLGIWGTI